MSLPDRIGLALSLLRLDPVGLGGLWLRGRAGPSRDVITKYLSQIPLPMQRLHLSVSDEQLFGGVDLSATLSSGEVQHTAGLLASPALLVLPMAERCGPGLAGRLANALDGQTGHALVALDEGAEPDEQIAAALADRLAFHIDINALSHGEASRIYVSTTNSTTSVAAHPDDLSALTKAALALGIDSLRAPLLALRAARAHAKLTGRDKLEEQDLEAAAALVLAPRATQLPTPPDASEPQPELEDTHHSGPAQADTSQAPTPPSDVVLEAALAALPPDALARLAAAATPSKGAQGSGAGEKSKGNRRGRPLPPRRGRLGNGARLDLVATLRAAVPWQKVRNAVDRIEIRPSDLRLKRFEDRSDRLVIFAVDASGSAAMARLAEAKGAVELLLAEAYAKRDHVAVLGFRGTGAELLLPPTRSLVQAKRRLAGLPGGGGTPLAAGLQAAMELALSAKGRGLSPAVALLTDGRANIALDGTANRQAASEDAEKLALSLRGQGTPALVIDTANRPQKPLEALANRMNAAYLPLPRADAERLSRAVDSALVA